MKRTTIMIEEDLLYEIKLIAKQQERSTSSVMREALAAYVTEQHTLAPTVSPLMMLIGLGESKEPMNLANGGDEEILRNEVHPIYGWSVVDDNDS